jgi:hypothetical protein
MNKHKQNWSAMGPGFSDPNRIKPVSESEYYRLIRITFNNPYPQECLSNLLEAIRKIKKELEI